MSIVYYVRLIYGSPGVQIFRVQRKNKYITINDKYGMCACALSFVSVLSNMCLTGVLLICNPISSFVSSRNKMNQYFLNCFATFHLKNNFLTQCCI